MSEIDIVGTGSIGQPSYLGGVSTTLPFDPKTARLPKELPEGRGNSETNSCLLYTSPSPRDGLLSRMPSSA